MAYMNYCILSCLILIISLTGTDSEVPPIVELNEDNWSTILHGEWMVEFMAPWCPACKSLQPVLELFSKKSKGLKILVGKVDITNSPGLSGRFMVTALPTIFHVKDGKFRRYQDGRDLESLTSFIRLEKWKKVEPISSWHAPDSLQMATLSRFFQLSQAVRTVHNMLLENYGLPAWASYALFAILTIIIGSLLGLLIVCFLDMVYPRRHPSPGPARQEKDSDAENEDDELASQEELIDEEEEKNSGASNDSDESEENMEPENEPEPEPAVPARRRKTRKAD